MSEPTELPPNAPIVAAYFPEWGIYSRDYNIADVPADQLTHLIYAFAKIDENNEIALFDSYAAVDKAFSAEDSVDGVADSWTDQDLRGNFNQIAELKALHPHLKTSIAVGGWTLSGNFSTMAASQEGRDAFVNSAVEFLREYDMFDGIDLDWEYPGGGGLDSNAVSAQDGANYALLTAELRAALDALEVETGRDYEISIASPGGFDKIENFNLEGLAPNVDFFNLMAYDFYGAWANTTGHQAAMFDMTGNGYDITTAVDLYLAAGVDPSQIVLGAPMYTRAWQGVDAATPIDAWNTASGGAAPGTFEAGVYDYKDLLQKLQDPASGWKLYYDDDAQAAFVYNEALGIFSSIETPQTVSLKSEWAQAMGLGGMMFWDLSNDSSGAESLLKAGADSWLGGLTFEEIAAASQLEWEEVFGGDGVVQPIAEADTPQIDIPDPDDGTGDGDNGGGSDGGGDGSSGDGGSGNDGGQTGGDGSGGDGTNDGGSSGDGGGTSGGDSGGDSGGSTGTAGVTKDTADVVITWSWGQNLVVTGFDPASDTIFIDWISADQLELQTSPEGWAVFALPSNEQSTTLADVSWADLSPANFTILDASAEAEVMGVIGTGTSDDGSGSDGAGDGSDNGQGDGSGDGGGSGDGDGSGGSDGSGDTGVPPGDGAGDAPDVVLGDGADTVALGWNWATTTTIANFDPNLDVIDFNSFSAEQLDISEQEGDLLIEVLGNGGDFTRLIDLQAEDLTMANLTAPDWNPILDPDSALIADLIGLGFDPLA